MEKKVIKLKHPIPVKKDGGGEVQVNEITLGRMKSKHLRLLPKNLKIDSKGRVNIDADAALPLIAGLSGLPMESIDEIDVEEDLDAVMEAVLNFLP